MKKINYICTRDGTVYENCLNRLVRLSRFDSRVWLLFTGMGPCVFSIFSFTEEAKQVHSRAEGGGTPPKVNRQ